MRIMARLLCVGGMSLLPASIAHANHLENRDNQPLVWFDTGLEVEQRAQTILRRTADAIDMRVNATQLEPGHAYSVWLVIFNHPDACVDECDDADLYEAGTEAAIIWSGIGGVANDAGRLGRSGTLVEGNLDGYPTFFGDLTDAIGAEIHMIVRSHGPASTDADELIAQTTSFEGGCTPASSAGLGTGTFECFDLQFSVHAP